MTTCPVCETKLPLTGKPRSLDQHRRFFGMIRAAYHHWPEGHDTQFSSDDDLRKWAQMAAGWRDIGSRTRLTNVKPETALLLASAAIAGAGTYARPVIHKHDLVVWRPKSIAFAKMPHLEFCALSDAVQEVIEAETGIKVDDMMREVA